MQQSKLGSAGFEAGPSSNQGGTSNFGQWGLTSGVDEDQCMGIPGVQPEVWGPLLKVGIIQCLQGLTVTSRSSKYMSRYSGSEEILWVLL